MIHSCELWGSHGRDDIYVGLQGSNNKDLLIDPNISDENIKLLSSALKMKAVWRGSLLYLTKHLVCVIIKKFIRHWIWNLLRRNKFRVPPCYACCKLKREVLAARHTN